MSILAMARDVALTFSCLAGFSSALSTRTGMSALLGIINGTVVEPTSPYHKMFALPTRGGDTDEWLGCGASIISPTYALTAAHCFGGGGNPCAGPSSLGLWIGDVVLDGDSVEGRPGGWFKRVSAEVTCHPDFDGKCSHGHDVALLKLSETVPDWVKPVQLDFEEMGVLEGSVVTAFGYGLTEKDDDKDVISESSSALLRDVAVTVLAQDNPGCARVFAGGYGCSDVLSLGAAAHLETQFCAGAATGPDRDACAGDSGSPLLDVSGRQVGLVSYGGGPGEKMTGPGRMCGDPAYPGVYSRVAAFREFIESVVTDLPLNG